MTERVSRGRLRAELLYTLSNVEPFSRRVLRRPLRDYQLEPARAIVDSVLQRRGLTLVVMMARQAGKNETAAQVEAMLLNLFRRRGGSLVKAAPTFRPQIVNSMLRLTGVVEHSLLPPAATEQGYIVRMGRARAMFFSADPQSNVVGATADILLEADEAQDIDEAKWNKDFRPMGASTNVTTVLWGTAWTSHTLLARTVRALRWAEGKDQVRRVFCVPWDVVAAAVPEYGRYVRGEVERLGRNHPLIRSQYYLEEIDDGGGMFPAATRALMRGAHPRQRAPEPGGEYALLLDVAGESEERVDGAQLREREPRKDSTALTVVEVLRQEAEPPRYRVMDRYWWTGTPHHELAGAIARLVELWGATRLLVDATGVGAGLASFLRGALGGIVRPVTIGARVKSDLGWGFLGICNSGRFQDYADDGAPETRQFWREVASCDYVVADGPNQYMRWGVADPAVHDDLLLSAALCALLDAEPPAPRAPTQLIEAPDVLVARGTAGEEGSPDAKV